LFGEQRRGKPPHEAPGCLTPIPHAVAGFLQPLFRGFFELGGDDRCLGKTEGAGGAAQPMGVAAQCFDCGRVVARGDQPFGQFCDRPQLITGSLQVFGTHSGG